MIGLNDVREAAARILGTIVRTPTIRSEALSRLVGAEVWLCSARWNNSMQSRDFDRTVW